MTVWRRNEAIPVFFRRSRPETFGPDLPTHKKSSSSPFSFCELELSPLYAPTHTHTFPRIQRNTHNVQPVPKDLGGDVLQSACGCRCET
jgi:hypothetical protein